MASIEMTAEERKTRELVEADRAKAEFNPYGQMLRSAILACWASALPMDRLVSIGSAIHGYRDPAFQDNVDYSLWQKELTRMVRAKVLRSRMAQGKRLYEVNY